MTLRASGLAVLTAPQLVKPSHACWQQGVSSLAERKGSSRGLNDEELFKAIKQLGFSHRWTRVCQDCRTSSLCRLLASLDPSL